MSREKPTNGKKKVDLQRVAQEVQHGDLLRFLSLPYWGQGVEGNLKGGGGGEVVAN